jgi:diketogulonate reductase-like aldo/keto reductase
MRRLDSLTRRDFVARTGVAAVAAGLASGATLRALAQTGIPRRSIPRTGETVPVIGLGSSKVVEQIAANGPEPVANVLRALIAGGGTFVDTWPRNAENDAAFGRVLAAPEFAGDKLFVTSKIDKVGKDAGIAQFRETQRLYQRQTLDLIQIFSLTDLDTHWPSLKEWKAEGSARYIGVTVSQDSRHADLEQFLRRENPDFVQMNYSITERAVEERLLPFAAERGVAVVINRPFMNGAYFDS